MKLDTQTTIFMICFVYLILHGAIWLALQEYRSFQVKLWCAAGMFSGMAVVLLSMRGQVADVWFFYVAQLLMLVGNGGRMVALRMYLLPEVQHRVHAVYNLLNISYFALFVYLIHVIIKFMKPVISPRVPDLTSFSSFETLTCFCLSVLAPRF